MNRIAPLVSALAFACSLTAQAGGDGRVVSERRYDSAFAAAESTEHPGDGLREFCAAISSTTPLRLPPGSTGKLLLTLSLRGTAVLPPDGRVALDYAKQQGVIQLERWSLQPAALGKLSPAYRGKPVHENTATIEIPITIGTGAAPGSHAVAFTLDADVYHGDTGQLICAAQMPIRADVVVGPALPSPPTRRPAGATVTSIDDGSGVDSVPSGNGSTSPNARARASRSLRADDARVAAPSPATEQSLDAIAASTENDPPLGAHPVGGSWLVLGAGIALLAAIVGLVLLRRRG